MILTITTTHKIEDQMIADLMTTAIESPYGEWCLRVEPGVTPPGPLKSPWYSNAEFWSNPSASANFTVEDPDTGGEKRVTVALAQIEQGLKKMSNHSPHRFTWIITDNYDAITAGIFLQYVIYGEVHYG